MEREPVNEEFARILDELREMRREGQDTRDKVTALVEQTKAVPDHETRLRALERWRYGIPVAGVTAAVAATISAFSATKGA
jgi:fatty acid desaturase